jgi:hypothetical protein
MTSLLTPKKIFPEDPEADMKLQAKAIIDTNMGKTWEDSYLLEQTSKEGRENFSEDPVHAKFQATARKGLLVANSTLRQRVGKNRRKSKNKIDIPELKEEIDKLLPKVEDEMKKNQRRSEPVKLEKQMKEVYEKKEKTIIENPDIKDVYELLLKVNERIDTIEDKMNSDMKEGKIQPLVTTNKLSKDNSKKWSEQLQNAVNEFKSRGILYAYVDFFESMIDVGYGLKKGDVGMLKLSKKLFHQWMKTTIASLRAGLEALLSASYKVAGVMWPGNWGSLPEAIIGIAADLTQLGIAVAWFWINLQTITAIAAIADILLGTKYATFMATIVQELFTFLFSMIADSLLLPIRTVIYIITKGSWDDLSTEDAKIGFTDAMGGQKHARLWYFMRYFLDTIGGTIGDFLDVLKESSDTLRRIINIGQTVFDIIAWTFNTLAKIVKSGIDITEFVVTNPVEAAKTGIKVAKEGIEVAARHGQKILETGTSFLNKNAPKLIKGAKNVIQDTFKRILNIGGQQNLKIGPNQYYDALFVCACLNVTMADLKQMQNKDMVNFVFNTPSMTLGEVAAVVHELSREDKPRELLLLEDKPKLKF